MKYHSFHLSLFLASQLLISQVKAEVIIHEKPDVKLFTKIYENLSAPAKNPAKEFHQKGDKKLDATVTEQIVQFETVASSKCPHLVSEMVPHAFNAKEAEQKHNINQYTIIYYKVLNKNDLTPADFKNLLKVVDGLNRLPTFEGDLFRGGKVSSSIKQQILAGGVGTVVSFPKLLSTSRYLSKAFQGGDKVLMIFKSKFRPSYIAPYSAYSTEEEVLIPPYVSFKVLEYDFDHSYEFTVRPYASSSTTEVRRFPGGKIVFEEVLPEKFDQYKFKHVKQTNDSIMEEKMAGPYGPILTLDANVENKKGLDSAVIIKKTK